MRLKDWPEKLYAEVRKANDVPFCWGKSDCVLFTCDCIKAMTGEDYAKGVRGKYSTEKGAFRILKKMEGVTSIEELATKHLGNPVELSKLMRGDVVSFESPTGPALGITLGRLSVFRNPRGMTSVETLSCLRGWRVI